MVNPAGVKVSDEVVVLWDGGARKLDTDYLCVCLKFLNKKCGEVVLDPDNHVMKEKEGVPDFNDYAARKPYEVALFNKFCQKLVSDDPEVGLKGEVRFFIWDFYFQTAGNKTIKTRQGLVIWIPEHCNVVASKMCGASVISELETRLSMGSKGVTVNEMADMDYDEIASTITQGFKN